LNSAKVILSRFKKKFELMAEEIYYADNTA
jgi:hypothetical protein